MDATRTSMPEGYRTITVQRQVGTGQAWFHTAVDRLISWEMHRRAGLLVARRTACCPWRRRRAHHPCWTVVD